ncbi:hypothetical protein HK104_001782, partial [Borealophlyctis nickersoniae]
MALRHLLPLLVLLITLTHAQPPPLYDFSATPLRTSNFTGILVAGGLPSKSTSPFPLTASDHIYGLDLGGNEAHWVDLANGGLKVTGHAAVRVGSGSVVVLFGVETYETVPVTYARNPVTVFHVANRSFTPVNVVGDPSPSPRAGHVAVYDAGRKYVWMWGGAGGPDHETTLRELWLLDLSVSPAKWTRMPDATSDMKAGTVAAVAAFLQNRWLVICFGTEAASSSPSNSCGVFDTQKRE